MPFHEAGVLSAAPAATADTAYIQLWVPTGAQRTRVREIGGTNTAATASKLAIKRTTARGTQTATQVVSQADPSDTPSTATVDSAFSVQPTVSGSYMRRAHVAATIGAGFVWTWWSHPTGLMIAANAGIAVVVPTAVAGTAFEIWVVVED